MENRILYLSYFSRVEQHGRVLSEVQQLTKETPTKATPPPAHVHKTIRPEKLFLPAIPKFSTEEIFVKKTEGMEEDYYIPPNRKRSKLIIVVNLNLPSHCTTAGKLGHPLRYQLS